MVAARRSFWKGATMPLWARAWRRSACGGAACRTKCAAAPAGCGCGEGWYDRCIASAFAQADRPLELAGFDIAKPAVRLAAKALPQGLYAVASSFAQPVENGWARPGGELFQPLVQE